MLGRLLTIKSARNYHSERVTLTGLIRSILNEPEHIIQERKNRRELLSLLKLEAHELLDMGLSRADVVFALRLPLTKNAAKELYRARKNSSKL